MGSCSCPPLRWAHPARELSHRSGTRWDSPAPTPPSREEIPGRYTRHIPDCREWFSPQMLPPRCFTAHVFGGDTWGPCPSATPSPQLLRPPEGLVVPSDVQMNQPGQEKPRGFMNSSSMMSFQSYPPEEHLLSPSSPAAPSQAFLSPPPSQAWGAMLLPRSKIPSANRATCQPPVPYSSGFGVSRLQPHGKALRER